MAKKGVVEKVKEETKELVKSVEKTEKKVEKAVAKEAKKVVQAVEGKKEAPAVHAPEIGEVTNYFDKISVAAIKLEKPVKLGDKVRFMGGETDFEQTIGSMQIHNKAVSNAKKGDEIGMKVNGKVRKGYRVLAA